MANAMIPMIETVLSGGTPSGMGHYDRVLKCPRFAYLLKKTKGKRSSNGANLPKYLLTGIIFHTFQQLYRTRGAFECARVSIKSVKDASARSEAERLFKAFRVRFGPDDFGRPVCIEETQTIQLDSIGPGWPALPFQIKPDLVTKVTKRDAARMRKLLRLAMAPGYWLWDWKTDAFMTRELRFYHSHSLRTLAYRLIWDAINPGKKLQGMIVHVTTKQAPPQFEAIEAKHPSTRDRKRLKTYFQRCDDILSSNRNKEARPDQCVTYRDRCQFYGNRCKGY